MAISQIDALFAVTRTIKALKTLVWHLSREPMKEMSSLKQNKKKKNSNLWRTSTDEGLTIAGTNWFRGWTPSGDKSLLYHCANRTIYGVIDIFNEKKKVLQSSMSWFCLFSYTVFNFLFECYWNTYLSNRKEDNSVYFLRLCTKYDTWFSKYGTAVIAAISSTNATKMKRWVIYKYTLKDFTLYPLTLSQTTNFGLFQTQNVCRRQFQIWWKWQKVLEMGRKHCGKRRNCSLRAISPFPAVFSKDLYWEHVKRRACLGKG